MYKREHLFLVAGSIVMLIPYFGNLFFPTPLGHRFLLFSVFYLHLALIWAVLEIQRSSDRLAETESLIGVRRSKTAVIVCFLGLCFLWNLALSVLEFSGYRIYAHKGVRARRFSMQPIVEDMKRLAQYFPSDAVILAPARVSWPIPTFKGKVVAVYHANPMVGDCLVRYMDTNRFFQVETSPAERLEILRKYNPTHIAYKKTKMPEVVKNQIKSFGEITGSFKDYVIMEVRGSVL
jgi:hypothetical protein